MIKRKNDIFTKYDNSGIEPIELASNIKLDKKVSEKNLILKIYSKNTYARIYIKPDLENIDNWNSLRELYKKYNR